MPIYYMVHGGYGKLSRTSDEEYIDAPTVGELYGLDVDDYEVGTPTEGGTAYNDDYIHLIPRPDGIYRNIKTELGDNGTSVHYRKMVNPEKWRQDNYDVDGNRSRL